MKSTQCEGCNKYSFRIFRISGRRFHHVLHIWFRKFHIWMHILVGNLACVHCGNVHFYYVPVWLYLPSFLPNIVLLCFVFIPLWQILILITRILYPQIMMTDLFLSTFNSDHYYAHYRYWDTRQANPVHVQQLPERCYALTVNYPLMIVGTADRNLVVFNLQNPQVIMLLLLAMHLSIL